MLITLICIIVYVIDLYMSIYITVAIISPDVQYTYRYDPLCQAVRIQVKRISHFL